MPGPAPFPSAVHKLRGNPSKKPINHREPSPGPLAPDCPKELEDKVARAEWNRIVPVLLACGMATAADRALLIAYCANWARWLAEYEAHDWDAAHKAFSHLVRAAVELGLTPSSRSRVHAVPPKAGSGWADVL